MYKTTGKRGKQCLIKKTLALISKGFVQLPPGEECVDPGVGGDDDDEGEEEDLAVVSRVVDVIPVGRAAILI